MTEIKTFLATAIVWHLLSTVGASDTGNDTGIFELWLIMKHFAQVAIIAIIGFVAFLTFDGKDTKDSAP